ncbi:hypothetical protein N7474_009783 [Penicillium riverlandense]|uniref:uncharacterized protein n=1 Tax=Penicillium riverlandense TaxID=1903569 RepID=UPI002547AFF0|nr:uncharacterized protein N7474_009783 [Penicillium riverlandense]KAJ5808514.1 hypothetical protein N7474_009783 [Penicillium riverlandense]
MFGRIPADQQLQSHNDPSGSNPATSPAGSSIIDPLPPLQRRGLIAVSSLASISLVTTFLLLLFLTYRLIFWRRYYRRYYGHNQYVVLVYNLALADFLQALGFLVSLRWITTNSIHASDALCFLQGAWLQIGNPMSGMFVLAIALYTFLRITMGYQLSHRMFVITVVSLWVFGVVMVIIPIAAVGRYVWFPAVAWCWITTKHPALRLWTHYFWIFAAQFFAVLLYAIIFIRLQRRIAECVSLGGRNTNSLRRLKRVVGYMVIYPVVFVSLTLPLAVGRMASASGHTPSVTYFCVAGSLMTLSGLCDTLLYTLNRWDLVLNAATPTSSGRLSVTERKNSLMGNMWSQVIHKLCSKSSGRPALQRSSTNEGILINQVDRLEVSQVLEETTIDITYEPVHPMGV